MYFFFPQLCSTPKNCKGPLLRLCLLKAFPLFFSVTLVLQPSQKAEKKKEHFVFFFSCSLETFARGLQDEKEKKKSSTKKKRKKRMLKKKKRRETNTESRDYFYNRYCSFVKVEVVNTSSCFTKTPLCVSLICWAVILSLWSSFSFLLSVLLWCSTVLFFCVLFSPASCFPTLTSFEMKNDYVKWRNRANSRQSWTFTTLDEKEMHRHHHHHLITHNVNQPQRRCMR